MVQQYTQFKEFMDKINQKTLVIGFGHKARQGKNTAVSTIYDTYKDKYDIRVYGFGDSLKEEVNKEDQLAICLENGIEYNINPPMDDPLCNTKHGKQSRLLQFWGEYRRKQDNFYWVKKVADKIMADKPAVALIHDVRYRNEAAFVKACGGYIVRVRREGFIDSGRDPNHTSEVELNNTRWDVDINVLDGAVEDLKRDALLAFESIVATVTPHIEDMPDVALVLS